MNKNNITATVIVAYQNSEKKLPAFFRALEKALPKDSEVLFVNAGASDSSGSLMADFAKQANFSTSLLEADAPSSAYRLGASRAQGEFLFFLSPHLLPQKSWLKEMLAALEKTPLAVSKLEYKTSTKPTPAEKLHGLLFKDYASFTAHAEGHALPWGPIHTLGIRSDTYKAVGEFSPAAGHAFALDWCWRALLSGYRLSYQPKAKLALLPPDSKEIFLEQVYELALGESWTSRSYRFLESDPQAKTPYGMAMENYERLANHPLAKKAKSPLLHDAAAAYSFGILAGQILPLASDKEKRVLPKKAISWDDGQKGLTLFVPGKGLTTINGKLLPVFRAAENGASEHELAHLFEKHFKLSHEEAHAEAEHFLAALSVE